MTEFLLTANECTAKAESPVAAVAQLFLTCANLDFELQAVISKMTRLVFCTQHQNLMFGLEWNCLCGAGKFLGYIKTSAESAVNKSHTNIDINILCCRNRSLEIIAKQIIDRSSTPFEAITQSDSTAWRQPDAACAAL